MSHTKEPWAIRERGDCGFGPEADLSVEMFNARRGYLRLADARRIVACVNACAGISTERLEKFLGATANKSVITLTTDNIYLKKQRDELLAASESLVKAMSGTQAETDFAFQMCMLEDAIASVKGSAA